MALKQQLDQDLKTAMLSGDKTLAETLRGLKSAILNIEIAKGKREEGLADSEIVEVLNKEAKKRQESAYLYKQGGNEQRAQAELSEKTVIAKYLPVQLSETDISQMIDEIEKSAGKVSKDNMGQIIGKIKQKTGGAADGAVIAALVKERLQ